VLSIEFENHASFAKLTPMTTTETTKRKKISAYQIFGWVPLMIFFLAAGITAGFGVLRGL